MVRPFCFIGIVVLLGISCDFAVRAEPASSREFHVRFTAAVTSQPFTGRVYLLLSKKESKTLPTGPQWFSTEPFFAVDVKDWKAGEPLRFTAAALGYPQRLNEIPAGIWWARAVMDFDRGERSFITAAGNGHSELVRVEIGTTAAPPVELLIAQVHQPTAFTESEFVKLVELPSQLLSQFHKRSVRMRAAVILPPSFHKEPQRHYPILCTIPGFSGTHFSALQKKPREAATVAGVEMIHVILDPSCRWGHHVFADSDNNGPWGQALCQELIPHIEQRFRALGQPTARFLTGHSSGGWSSLWLQVTYPDFFGGVWSTAPDPVDFRDFQRVNIYQPNTNIFHDEAKKPRPLARRGDKILAHYKDFSDMEAVMGHGGQLGSFEAVFSPREPDSRPLQLWDRQTGQIHRTVAEYWKRYDIRLLLVQNWAQLEPRLAGKIHVYMGTKDSFYLEGAVRKLKESLAQLGSDAVIELFPDCDHSKLLSQALRDRIAVEMARQFHRIHKSKSK